MSTNTKHKKSGNSQIITFFWEKEMEGQNQNIKVSRVPLTCISSAAGSITPFFPVWTIPKNSTAPGPSLVSGFLYEVRKIICWCCKKVKEEQNFPLHFHSLVHVASEQMKLSQFLDYISSSFDYRYI